MYRYMTAVAIFCLVVSSAIINSSSAQYYYYAQPNVPVFEASQQQTNSFEMEAPSELPKTSASENAPMNTALSSEASQQNAAAMEVPPAAPSVEKKVEVKLANYQTAGPCAAPCGDSVSVTPAQYETTTQAPYAANQAAPLPPCTAPQPVVNLFPIETSPANLNCDCPGKTTNCTLTRFYTLPAPCANPECLVCVQEPFICEKTETEYVDVVVYGCKQSECHDDNQDCHNGKCVHETVTRTVTELTPCKAKIPITIKKAVIEYRKVWICIACPPVPPSPNPCPPCP